MMGIIAPTSQNHSVGNQAEKSGRSRHVRYMLRGDEGTVEVPLDALKAGDSPRAKGEEAAHTRTLAETDAALPPILVHRATMRVIDGMHRIRAAELRGDETIAVRFFDGDENEAFVLSVKSNIAHGLPLSLADRKAAALRIVTSHPQWSDRMIADVTGLAHKTVGAIRRRLGSGGPRPVARVGRDGRVRTLNSGVARLRASGSLAEGPRVTSEQIGFGAGIPPATGKDVRGRLQRGEDPLSPGRQCLGLAGPAEYMTAPDTPAGHTAPDYARCGVLPSVPGSSAAPGAPGAHRGAVARRSRQGTSGVRSTGRAAAFHLLQADPSVRFTESGRALLRWLGAGPRTVEESAALAGLLPERHFGLIAALARGSAASLLRFSDELERRSGAQTS